MTMNAVPSKSRDSIQENGLRDSVAVTIQTNYDIDRLRGKGFIYVAPESGPMALAGANVAHRPWSRLNSSLLLLTLHHELGHVFGLQHTPGAEGLMGARTLEHIMDKKSVDGAEANPTLMARFTDRPEGIESFTPCGLSASC
jgi:hypothetical protein